MQGELSFDASIMGAYVCAHRHRRHLPAKSGYDSEKRQVHFADFVDHSQAGGCVFGPYPLGEEVRTREKRRTSCVRFQGFLSSLCVSSVPKSPQAPIQTLDSFLKSSAITDISK